MQEIEQEYVDLSREADPLAQAQAESVRNRSESETVAGAYRFMQRMLEERDAALVRRERELDAREERVRARELKIPEMEVEAQRRGAELLMAAEGEANRLIREAVEEASKVRTTGLADAEYMRTQARDLLASSAAAGQELRALPRPATTGASVAGELGQFLIGKVAEVAMHAMSVNPNAAAAFNSLIKGQGQPAPTMAEVEAAYRGLTEEQLTAFLASVGKARVEELTPAELVKLVEVAAQSRKEPNGSG
jgi:hypothetical protein